MKFYAVRKGRTPGVYRTWKEAQKQVNGFSNAEFKSFENITDATDYLGWDKQEQDNFVQKSVKKKKVESSLPAEQDTLENALKKIMTKSKEIEKGEKAKPKTHKTKTSAQKNKPKKYFAKIYTDGGTRNTGVYKGGHVNQTDKAAWAYLIEWDKQKVYDSGGEYGATNNKMEQTALINALEKLMELQFNEKQLLFVLDSRYVLDAINKHWLKGWKKRGWKRAGGELSNVKEWQKLDELLAHFPNSSFKWTKGHAGNRGNEFVDHELNRYMDEKM